MTTNLYPIKIKEGEGLTHRSLRRWEKGKRKQEKGVS